MKHYGDITKLSGYELPVVDVITGGSPCQDLSVAGKRAGLDGKRSGLFMEQVRIVKEMREHDRLSGRSVRFIRPRYMVWENVPGAFSSNGGKDFQAVLTEIVKIAEPDAPDVPLPEKNKWPKAGCLHDEMGSWSIAWRVHDAQFWGVPQRRKRIALVADFGGLSAPEILFIRRSLSGGFEPGETAREEAAGAVGSGVDSAISCQERAGKPGGGKGILIQHEKTGALSTLNSQSVLCLNDQGGSVMSVTEDISGTLRAQEHGHQPIVAGFKHKASGLAGGVGYEEEKAPSLMAGQEAAVYDARGNGEICCTLTGDHQDRVTDYTALCVGNGQLNQISMAEQANTLDTMHDQQAIDCRNGTENAEVNGTLQAKPSGGGSLNLNNTCRQGAVVRRLTPLEYERLQGYPDGWTDIGEWVDSKGKKHKEADSPRYKALGNSIALPFWQWLARRICAQYERDITMASLFDGIGGFPYVFERCGAKAVWASEIEEYAMAVTRKHFPEDEA